MNAQTNHTAYPQHPNPKVQTHTHTETPNIFAFIQFSIKWIANVLLSGFGIFPFPGAMAATPSYCNNKITDRRKKIVTSFHFSFCAFKKPIKTELKFRFFLFCFCCFSLYCVNGFYLFGKIAAKLLIRPPFPLLAVLWVRFAHHFISSYICFLLDDEIILFRFSVLNFRNGMEKLMANMGKVLELRKKMCIIQYIL